MVPFWPLPSRPVTEEIKSISLSRIQEHMVLGATTLFHFGKGCRLFKRYAGEDFHRTRNGVGNAGWASLPAQELSHCLAALLRPEAKNAP